MNMEIVAKRSLFGGRRDTDMTEGSIPRHIITFAIPLLLGNVLQQLYNMVDTWVVGNYVSDEAFSAVGTVGPISNLLISLFVGFSTGAGVVVSQFYGAKQYDKVRDTVHTVILISFFIGLLITGVGIAVVPGTLRLINTPDEVMGEAVTYLTVYFAGSLGLVLYNVGSGILRAVGDSRHPFYYLAVSTVTNMVLDLLFVLVFGMGVEGVALATVIAQALSAGLILFTLFKSTNCVRLELSRMRIHKDELIKVLRVSLPVSIQMMLTSFSNVFVQSYINMFGKAAMGGYTAYSKIDQLLLLPMQTIALASTTFVGQNLGKGNEQRAKQGIRVSLLMAFLCTGILMLPVMLFAPRFVWFFNKDQEIIAYGTLFLRWISPCYLLCCVNQIYAGALRGSGNSTAPMLLMLFSFVAFRQSYLFVMYRYISQALIPLAMSYPAGWLMASILLTLYFRIVGLRKGRLVKDEKKDEPAEAES